MLHVHYTNDVINGEEGPNIFMFGDKEDWENFLAEINHFFNIDYDSLEFTNPHYDIKGSNKLILERDDYNTPFIDAGSESIHIVYTRDMWEDFRETVKALSSDYCFDYIDFDDMIIQQNANFIVESSSLAEEWAKMSP